MVLNSSSSKRPMGGQPKTEASSWSSPEVRALWQLTGLFLTQRDKKRERELESIIPVSLISRGRGSPLLNADPDKFCSKRELPMQYDFRVGGLSSKQTERLWPRSGRGSK